MPEARYTVDDSPLVVERIERDLAHILDVVRRADPYLHSLVLTGGFARGEGATLHGVPQNDYDLVAVRSVGPPRQPYADVLRELEEGLELHIDLATVGRWRLPWVARSIFWYETALRGRVLWGHDLLHKIPIRDPRRIHPTEALRLLVNRGAGLLLSTETPDPRGRRLQAAKALLAVMDSRLLEAGVFPPSQTERWERASALHKEGTLPAGIVGLWPWLEWAYGCKVRPAQAPHRPADEAWAVAARAILQAVPAALRHAGLATLDEYRQVGGLVDRVRYFCAAGHIPGARRLASHPTGTVRVATLHLLQAALDGTTVPAAMESLRTLATAEERPLRLLEALRRATAQ